MIKKALSLLIAALFAFSLAACAKDPALPGESDAPGESPAPGTADSAQPTGSPDNHVPLTFEEVYDPETDYNNSEGRCQKTVMTIDDAYYYPSPFGTYLYYYDTTNGDRGVVCPRPECTHDEKDTNPECGGCLGDSSAKTVCYCNGVIYYAAWVNQRQRFLYSMAPDGSDHKRLINIDCDPKYYPEVLAVHRGKLYGASCADVVEDAVPIHKWSVSVWDLKTGEYKLIYEENAAGCYPGFFFFGKYVYFCAAYQIDFHEEEGEFYGDVTLEIFRYDSETGELEKLFERTSPEFDPGYYMLWVAAEDRIYVANYCGSDKVFLLSNGKLSVALDLGMYTNPYLYKQYVFCISGSKETEGYWHIRIFDYDGSMLYDGEVTNELICSVEHDDDFIINPNKTGGYYGVFANDEAFFVIYAVPGKQFTGKKQKDPVPKEYTCVIKYELVDGELKETLTCVGRWN